MQCSFSFYSHIGGRVEKAHTSSSHNFQALEKRSPVVCAYFRSTSTTMYLSILMCGRLRTGITA